MAYRKTRTSRPRPKARKATPRRGSNGGNVWTRQEIAFLRQYYRKHETSWCARQLGRTVYSVRYKASDLSIKKASPSVWKGNKGGSVKPTRSTKSRTTRKPARRSTSRTRWATSKKRTTRRAKPKARKITRKAKPARRKITRKASTRRTATRRTASRRTASRRPSTRRTASRRPSTRRTARSRRR